MFTGRSFYLKAIAFLIVFCFSCETNIEKLFYKKSEILDIKRDDESQYHLLFKFENGETVCVSDVHCKIKMGDYKPTANIPFTIISDDTLGAWGSVYKSRYSFTEIEVYLPNNYNIQLFND